LPACRRDRADARDTWTFLAGWQSSFGEVSL
jgi:hypothetical protein